MQRKKDNTRISEVDIDSIFIKRWSPRSFLPDPIPEKQLKSIFEAARWAPSCFNDQPWVFIYASTPDEKNLFSSALMEANSVWASKAPVLAFLITRLNFTQTGKPNRHAAFDAGSAWMSLALQARQLGIYAHAMAGFDKEKAYEILKVPKDKFDVLIAIALGKIGDPNNLPENLRKMESPNSRKPLSEMLFKGTLFNK